MLMEEVLLQGMEVAHEVSVIALAVSWVYLAEPNFSAGLREDTRAGTKRRLCSTGSLFVCFCLFEPKPNKDLNYFPP